MFTRSWRLPAGCLAIALAVAGCGGSATSAGGARAGATTPATTHGTGGTSLTRTADSTATGHGVSIPAGFWYGSDSWPIPMNGRGPYTTVRLGGAYGGYVGMAGNWARWQGCGTGNFLAWSGANAKQADTNYSTYRKGIGTGVYWYMGGPGVDPRWNGTAGEASAWGAKQAAAALASAAKDGVTYPVLFMDIEMPGIAPAPDNGWTSVYISPCGGIRRSAHVTAALARAEFNGFDGYLTAHSRYKAGVYSDAVTWTAIFGTGSASRIPHTYEWTYWPETANLGDAPRGWCLKSGGTCAQFFGGVTGGSDYAVMWQWSGGGGVRNPIGDFDQIDTTTVR